MNTPHSLSYDSDEPLALLRLESDEAVSGLACHRFEFSSRGDRVSCHLLFPNDSKGTLPLVLVQTDDLSRNAADLFPVALAWARSGAALLASDLPLHGSRASSKLTARLRGGLGQSGEPDSAWAVLWGEFLRQAECDARRGLDAAMELGSVDAARVVCVGSGLASLAALLCCAADPRPRALALAPSDAKAGASELRSLEAFGEFAGPVAIVESSGGLAAAMIDAAKQPKRIPDGREVDELAPLDAFVREQLGL